MATMQKIDAEQHLHNTNSDDEKSDTIYSSKAPSMSNFHSSVVGGGARERLSSRQISQEEMQNEFSVEFQKTNPSRRSKKSKQKSKKNQFIDDYYTGIEGLDCSDSDQDNKSDSASGSDEYAYNYHRNNYRSRKQNQMRAMANKKRNAESKNTICQNEYDMPIHASKQIAVKQYVYIVTNTQETANKIVSLISSVSAAINVTVAIDIQIRGINVKMNNVDMVKSDIIKANVNYKNKCNNKEDEEIKEFCSILALNVNVPSNVTQMAEKMGVEIFKAKKVNKLCQKFKQYVRNICEYKRNGARNNVVFPVEMQILSPKHVFNNKHPIIIGVKITRGTLRIGTPIVVKLYDSKGVGAPAFLGIVTSIQQNHRNKLIGKQGDNVSVKIESEGDDKLKNIQVGRSFSLDEKLISEISRSSIDALKLYFRDELTHDDIQHLRQLKKYFGI